MYVAEYRILHPPPRKCFLHVKQSSLQGIDFAVRCEDRLLKDLLSVLRRESACMVQNVYYLFFCLLCLLELIGCVVPVPELLCAYCVVVFIVMARVLLTYQLGS